MITNLIIILSLLSFVIYLVIAIIYFFRKKYLRVLLYFTFALHMILIAKNNIIGQRIDKLEQKIDKLEFKKNN